MTSLAVPATTRFLQLAENLMAEARSRPDEQTRLTNAAVTAQRCAELSLDTDVAASGYLEQAAELLEPALHAGIPASVVTGARVYADMAATSAAQLRAQRQQAEEVQR